MVDNLLARCAENNLPVIIHISPALRYNYGLVDEMGLPRLEKMLKNARVIEASDVNVDVVSEYSNVTLINLETGEPLSFQIVGSVEAKPFEYKISNESPVGKALLGHKVGQEVDVQAPAGLIRYRIVSIQK